MILKGLEVYQFRNLCPLNVQFSPELNFIVGKNGQGKTNLIEAIHILSTGRSFRAANLKQVVSWGQSEASLSSTIEENVSDKNLRIILGQKSREYLVDDKKVSSLVDFVGNLVTVSFSPDDLQIVKGGPIERRKFIDKHIVDRKPALISNYVAYQKALKNKNSLLKSKYIEKNSLRPWNEILAREGLKIATERQKFISDLQQASNAVYNQFSSTDGMLTFEYKSGFIADEHLLEVDKVLDKLEANMERELVMKSSLYGTHRDDVFIQMSNKDSRKYSSQGQVRSIVLALKLGVINLLEESQGESPVVLLDDVDSELDDKRSSDFFDLLLRQKRQVFITGTSFSNSRLSSGHSSSTFTIKQGALES